MSAPSSIPTPQDVAAAAERLDGVANRTPVLTSRTLNEIAGCEVFLKCENFQRVGAFKFRGAYNAISQLTPEQKAAGVITHSSGNHAQGVALAAQLLDVPATIVMPEDAPPIKRAATADYGAEIVTCPAIERENVSAELAEKHGYTLIHPYDNPQIIAGQGTAAWELFQEVGPLDTLFTPVGGGGLISGSALAAAHHAPDCRVVGVEPALADDANRSWRQGEIVTLDYVPPTVADGLRTRFVGEHNLAVMAQYVADMTTTTEAAIMETLEFIWTRLKIIVEPSAAVALAPLFSGAYQQAGKRVGVIFSGGNVNVPACGFFHQGVAGNGETEEEAGAPPGARSGRPRVLVCDAVDEAGLEILRETADLDIEIGIDNEDLLARMGDYEGIIVGRERRVTGQMIEYGFHLRAIACVSSHLDHIDVSAARAMGIEVINAPGGNAVAIAEHTLARLLRLAERFADGRLAGKTLGIIGYGGVGREVAQRAKAFDMRILANQPRLTPELAMAEGVEATDLHDLLRQADFVSLHVPFKEETDAIIGEQELALMQPSACLLNPGHTDLVEDAALLAALDEEGIAGAVVPELPPQLDEADYPLVRQVHAHPRTIVAPHVTTVLGNRRRDASIQVARELRQVLRTQETHETLSLELVPADKVIPHEQIDEKRVSRLMQRLETDGMLVNPPITTFWNGRYIVLDGATRTTALKNLEFPHIITQVAPSDGAGFQLHTWYHAISSPQPFTALRGQLNEIEGLRLQPLPTTALQTAFHQENALCYFLDRDGNATLALAEPGHERLAIMKEVVARYTAWGEVERTLLTDLSRLLAQFPRMTAVAVFPQFEPEDVFETADKGEFLPAGLTRFVIPGRILRLNADLNRLKRDEPLSMKRAWFNRFLEEKLARSRMRYYQEPVILLDE